MSGKRTVPFILRNPRSGKSKITRKIPISKFPVTPVQFVHIKSPDQSSQESAAISFPQTSNPPASPITATQNNQTTSQQGRKNARMYQSAFGDEELVLGRLGERIGTNQEQDSLSSLAGLYMPDQDGEFPSGASSSSSSIPIPINGRSNQANLSESNDSYTSTRYPTNSAMPELPTFGAFLNAAGVESDAPLGRYATLPNPRGMYPGQFVGSLPPDPFPAPSARGARAAKANGLRNMTQSAQHHDVLSMVYGESAADIGFPPSLLSQHLFGGHPQCQSEITDSPSNGVTGLNGSLFQFRTQHPASTEQFVEKQKKRKESHNMVERRRRDHINEMIKELGCLVDEGDGESVRMNKGEILQRAVERLRYLEQVVHHQRQHLALTDPTFQLPQITIQPAARIQEAFEDG